MAPPSVSQRARHGEAHAMTPVERAVMDDWDAGMPIPTIAARHELVEARAAKIVEIYHEAPDARFVIRQSLAERNAQFIDRMRAVYPLRFGPPISLDEAGTGEGLA
jgi:hypothetical protein